MQHIYYSFFRTLSLAEGIKSQPNRYEIDLKGLKVLNLAWPLVEQYEQRRRNVNAARADSFLALAAAPDCLPAELLERFPFAPRQDI